MPLPIEKQAITWSAICKLAKELNVEPAALWAVAQIEAEGGGFNPVGNRNPISPKLKIDTTGLAVIRFEGHVFWQECLKRRIDPKKLLIRDDIKALLGDVHDIVYPYADINKSKGYAAGYDSLSRARQINEDAALCACSWGFGQVMGYHYASLGWESPTAWEKDMNESYDAQARAFTKFIQVNNLARHLRNHDWASFARAYNGKNYKANKYDTKMAAAYAQVKSRPVVE